MDRERACSHEVRTVAQVGNAEEPSAIGRLERVVVEPKHAPSRGYQIEKAGDCRPIHSLRGHKEHEQVPLDVPGGVAGAETSRDTHVEQGELDGLEEWDHDDHTLQRVAIVLGPIAISSVQAVYCE